MVQALVYNAASGTLPTRHFEVKAKVATPRMRPENPTATKNGFQAAFAGLPSLASVSVWVSVSAWVWVLVCASFAGAGLAGCATQLARPAPFRARPDSVARGDLSGPFSGRVIDSETDRPVPGALVYASWRFVSGSGFVTPDGFRDWIGSTDAQGRYAVPELEDAPGGGRLADFHLLVYKRGYVAYRSDRRFDDLGLQTEFSQEGASVTLYRWRPDYSHAKHLRYVGGGAALAALTAWEMPDAVAELSGANPQILAQKAKEAAAAERLDASKLLTAADVKSMTSFEGAFDTGELGDEPQSEHYDTVHLQARGKDESYDVALRMWRYPVEEAAKQFDRLVGDLPGAAVKNEIAVRP